MTDEERFNILHEARAAIADWDHEAAAVEYQAREVRLQEERRRSLAETTPLALPQATMLFTPAQDEALAAFVRRECERVAAGMRSGLDGLADEIGDLQVE